MALQKNCNYNNTISYIIISRIKLGKWYKLQRFIKLFFFTILKTRLISIESQPKEIVVVVVVVIGVVVVVHVVVVVILVVDPRNIPLKFG